MKIIVQEWNRTSDVHVSQGRKVGRVCRKSQVERPKAMSAVAGGRATYDVRLTGATCDITTCVSRKVEMSVAYVVSRKSNVQKQ